MWACARARAVNARLTEGLLKDVANTLFPAWFAVSKVPALMQPSSAAAEYMFSLSEALFGKKGKRMADLVNGS